MTSTEKDEHTNKDYANKYPADAILDNLYHRSMDLTVLLERVIELVYILEKHFSDEQFSEEQ